MALKIYVDFTLAPEPMALLREGTAEHELVFPEKPADSVLSKAKPDPVFFECDVAFGQPDLEAIKSSKSLKLIQINSSGITAYDTPDFRNAMSERKIPVCNSANVYNEACADHVLAFMLAQSRQIPRGLDSLAANGTEEWHEIRRASRSLKGQSAIILGYGAIGSRLVELLAPFEMSLKAFRRKARGDETIPVVTNEDLTAALGQADHIINILPDSEATRNFFDSERFAECSPQSVFYNIGRGTTVDQEALSAALQSGKIEAAWLDVTTPEPLPADHKLRHLPNCHITPHTAGGFNDESIACVQHFLNNLNRFTARKELVNRVM